MGRLKTLIAGFCTDWRAKEMNPLSKSLINCGFQVRARLNEAWLESGEVAASSNPHFGTELAWEVGGQNYDFFPSRHSGH